jgi:hypothetical protein
MMVEPCLPRFPSHRLVSAQATGVDEVSVMRKVESPPTAPDFDVDVYLVLDDFGTIGRAYREANETQTDRETVIQYLLSGEYNNPVRVVWFNTAQGLSRDATLEIVREIQERASRYGLELSPGLRDFIEYEIAREKRRESVHRPPISSHVTRLRS